MQLLGDITPETFLREYWQKKPLLIRQAIPGLQSPVDPNELAGLACEPSVESRLVIENDQGKPWQLYQGPFEAERFSELPSTHWTLLVQGLDHWVPEIADLLARFRFIPNWRLDDIMASYAPRGGSVGPHFDHYDVFLLQADGHREWRIGDYCNAESERVEGTPLSILKQFNETDRWVLEPGDMLYLPPHLSHWGIAQDDCMTFSIGFRAPAHADILTGFTDYLSEPLTEANLYQDPDLTTQASPGEISGEAIGRLQDILKHYLDDPRALALWFGETMTDPKHGDIVMPPEQPLTPDALDEGIRQGHSLRWNEGSRYAWHDLPGDDTVRALFVDGQRFLLRGDARAIAPTLCDQHILLPGEIRPHLHDSALLELVTTLINQGSLYLESFDHGDL